MASHPSHTRCPDPENGLSAPPFPISHSSDPHSMVATLALCFLSLQVGSSMEPLHLSFSLPRILELHIL